MKKSNHTQKAVLIISLLLFFTLTMCENYRTQLIYNSTCKCDSIDVDSYDFYMDGDSNIYSIPQKAPFNFQFIIDSCYIELNKREYHYCIAGINVDTIGLINITKSEYNFRKDINGKDVKLFDFTAKLNQRWKVNNGGYFDNYNIELHEVKYDEIINDSIYCFNFYYTGMKLPNGYFFERFEVSQLFGIVKFSFDNGVMCYNENISTNK